MNKLAQFLSALVPCLILAACQSGPPSNDPKTAPLYGMKTAGSFSLINQDGVRVSDTDFAGKYRMVYFGYTSCPDVCPTDVRNLMQGLKAFEKQDPARGAKVQPLFITVDPARDTSVVLKAFVSAYHPRLIGLTGTLSEIADVAKKYSAVYQLEAPVKPGVYIVDHSRTTVLYGPKGDPLILMHQDSSADDIAAQLASWVQ
jgi:protein SCO1